MSRLANERAFGTYRRQISLGDGVDASRIAATYDNGVLTVTIPVAEAVKPRHIEVARGGSPQSIEPTAIESQ
jgi:HSP20 family protein